MRYKILFFCLVLASQAMSQTDESWRVYDDSQVSRVDITINPDTLTWIYEHPETDDEHLAQCRFHNSLVDQTFDSVGFRLRGNTSRLSAKKSFKVSFNSFIKGRNLLGIEKLNLNGEHNDPSIARSKFCFDRWADIGLPASRASHTEVYINGDYYGLYVSVEHIDEEFLRRRFADAAGNLWKCLYPADLVYKGDNLSAYGGAYELKTNEQQNDFSQLIRLMKRLGQTPVSLLPDTLDKIMVVDEALKYLAMNTLLGSWDDYRSLMNNYYLYLDPSSGQFHLVPYDYDNTFGVDWAGVDWAVVDPYDVPKIAAGDRPLSDRVLLVPEWRNLYTLFLEFFAQRVMPVELWGNQPDSVRIMLTPFAQADQYRTLDYGFTMDDFTNSYGPSYSNQHVKTGITQFVDERLSSLTGMLEYVESDPVAWSSSTSARYPAPGEEVTIETSAFYHPGILSVEAWFKVNGGPVQYFPLEYTPSASSKNVDDWYRWKADVGSFQQGDVVEWHIRITATDGKTASWPRSHWYRMDVAVTPEQLLVNEVMASNATTVTDPQGDFDDWAELFNPSGSPVLLTGCYVTDNPDKPAKFRITNPDVVVPPGGYLLVWCDDDAGDPGIHTDFKLSADGEFFGLVAPDGTTWIDSVSFGPQQTDISYGRLPNGGDSWNLMPPTPLAPNQGTGVNDVSGTFACSFIPNPVTGGLVNLDFTSPVSGKVTVCFFDLAGRQVGRHSYACSEAGRNTLPISIEGLRQGVYLAEISSGSKRCCRKLIVR